MSGAQENATCAGFPAGRWICGLAIAPLLLVVGCWNGVGASPGGGGTGIGGGTGSVACNGLQSGGLRGTLLEIPFSATPSGIQLYVTAPTCGTRIDAYQKD